MTKEEALNRLHEIVLGIDQDGNSDDSWWETSAGAEFGAQRLRLLEALISDFAGGPIRLRLSSPTIREDKA